MAAPTLITPYSTSYSTGPQTEFTLSPPATNRVGFYVVGIDLPASTTPSSSPAFQRPRDTYSQVWPTITNWEVGSFAFAVRGAIDLPILKWTFPVTFNSLTIAYAEIEDCTFQLRAANIFNSTEDNLSPAAQPGAFYSLRGGIGTGDSTGSPPLPQMVTVAETATVPAQAADPSASPATPFSAIYATVTDAGPPTLGDDVETFNVSTWSTNTSFFPDVWGSTLSIFAPSDAPDATYGWHTGRIGWA